MLDSLKSPTCSITKHFNIDPGQNRVRMGDGNGCLAHLRQNVSHPHCPRVPYQHDIRCGAEVIPKESNNGICLMITPIQVPWLMDWKYISGGWANPLKNMSSSAGMIISNIWTHKKMFQTTNQENTFYDLFSLCLKPSTSCVYILYADNIFCLHRWDDSCKTRLSVGHPRVMKGSHPSVKAKKNSMKISISISTYFGLSITHA